MEFLGPILIAEGGNGFGADAGNGLQQKLGDIAEGDGVFARDAVLREKAKDLAEGAVHSGSGGEVGGEVLEFGGQGEFALGKKGENLLLAGGMVEAKIGMLIGAEHAALALVGREKATARGIGIRMLGGRRVDGVIVVLVRERIDIGGTRRRREGADEWFLYGSHMQCYREGKPASMVLVLRRWNGCGNCGGGSGLRDAMKAKAKQIPQSPRRFGMTSVAGCGAQGGAQRKDSVAGAKRCG